MKKIIGYLFYFFGFYLLYVIIFYAFPKVINNIEFEATETIIGSFIGTLLLVAPAFFLLKFANRWTKLKRKYFWGVFATISVFAFVNEEEYLPFNYDNQYIIWSKKNVDWTNFKVVESISDEFDAAIFTGIFCPRDISDKDLSIYAYMNPSKSEKINDSLLSSQLLIHEQYHFNITEYYARLLRKAYIKLGRDKLTIKNSNKLFNKFNEELDSIQDMYDSITEHNFKRLEQRYWELKIDEWLRETAYYELPNLNHYYSYSKGKTNLYRKILHTFDGDVLTSYPIYNEQIKYDEVYEVTELWDTITIKFYKNGELKNGGTYKSAITKIIKNGDNTFEVHYYNKDESYNSDLAYCLYKCSINENDLFIGKYYNIEGNRVNNDDKVYETRWKILNENIALITYFNKEGLAIKNKQDVYHKKKYFDTKRRIIRVENYDLENRLINNNENVSIYEISYTDKHLYKTYKKFDKNGKHLINSDSYNLKYVYDERGKIKKRINLNSYNHKINDNDGVCIYEYCYDIYGNCTQTKRFNKNNLPVLASEDYFQWVTKYDSIGRATFNAKYYMEYRLKYDDEKWGATKVEYPSDSLMVYYNLDVYNDLINDNSGIAITNNYKNSKDEIIRSENLNKDNSFSNIKKGVVSYLNKFDENGNNIELITLDSLGNFINSEADVAKTCWEYDVNNNKIKASFYNTDFKLANGNGNVAFNFYSYNKHNQLIERSYYNKKNEPILFEGAFRIKFYPNKKGNDTLIKKYNTKDNLINGVCTIKYEYNAYNNLELESYYNSENIRVNNTQGISAIKHNYDNRQRLISYSFLDINDSIKNNKLGYSTIVYELNENSSVISESYFDKNNKPVLGPENYHKKEIQWNEMDLYESVFFYDIEGNLTEDSDGFAVYEYHRAKSGLISLESFYDKFCNLKDDNSGAAEIHYASYLNGLYYLDKRINSKGEVLVD